MFLERRAAFRGEGLLGLQANQAVVEVRFRLGLDRRRDECSHQSKREQINSEPEDVRHSNSTRVLKVDVLPSDIDSIDTGYFGSYQQMEGICKVFDRSFDLGVEIGEHQRSKNTCYKNKDDEL